MLTKKADFWINLLGILSSVTREGKTLPRIDYMKGPYMSISLLVDQNQSNQPEKTIPNLKLKQRMWLVEWWPLSQCYGVALVGAEIIE